VDTPRKGFAFKSHPMAARPIVNMQSLMKMDSLGSATCAQDLISQT
jgi:hypothetical protein